ncbi:hypothetical protein [Paenibacillus methanolicus]|uniref:Uncharacterized protein n=1 Tax=Paenibacillus methanolicus TaxID=582686 RepID=A0A5S5BVR3_9BACL|nr:hypothetical protein [Paenibacillus methanolicus]TYP71064.1 hypothetical protein BCM02_11013 [Paenibacillus methanolicus]
MKRGARGAVRGRLWLMITFLLIALLLGAIGAMFAGCSSANSESEAAGSTEGEARRQAERAAQTLWHVLDAEGNQAESVADEHPDVIAVRKLLILHANAINNRSYKTIRPEEELAYYTETFRSQLGKRYQNELKQLYEQQQIEIKQRNLAWYDITFAADYRRAQAKVEDEFEFVACEPQYLAARKLSLGKSYKQQRVVDLVKEGDAWRIADIKKSPLTEGSAKNEESVEPSKGGE